MVRIDTRNNNWFINVHECVIVLLLADVDTHAFETVHQSFRLLDEVFLVCDVLYEALLDTEMGNPDKDVLTLEVDAHKASFEELKL